MDEAKQNLEPVLIDSAPASDDNPSKPDELPIPTTVLKQQQTPEASITDKVKQIQDVTLTFLSKASNETLGACAVGLCASTYFVLGRVGLLLIGAVGGIVLHATWEGHYGANDNGRQSDLANRRRELGVEVAKRVLDWRDGKKEVCEKDLAVDKIEASTIMKNLNFSEFQPETGSALTELTDAIIRDYVDWWYKPLLPTEMSFPSSCRQTLTGFLLSMSNHLSRKRAADPFLDFLANSTSIVLVFLNELATALKASQRADAEVALRTYLEYQPDSNLANVIDSAQQERKFRLVAEEILESFLESKAYNCPPAKSFLRETLSGLVLQGMVNTCGKPEWINGFIISMLEDGEPELLNAIDAGVEEMEDKLKDFSETTTAKTPQERKSARRVSRAEEAMQEAMREAQRMNEMIAEEEEKRQRELRSTAGDDSASITTTNTNDNGLVTPTSSDSEAQHLQTPSFDSSMIFDIEGNTIPSATNSPRKQPSSPKAVAEPASTFTSFDQLGPMNVPTALSTEYHPPAPAEVMVAAPLTLFKASINILDMGEGNDRVPMKQKPLGDMLVQIEPASSRFPGWMITRKYNDFEPLHETLRRIAVISGVFEFSQQYPMLPGWKNQTRAAMITELEGYLKLALQSERLAESDAMKKFLDKELGLGKAPANSKNVLVQGSAALENVGKGFINVLGQGGKGLQTGFQTGGKAFQTGGKAVLGGVTGVFGAVTSGVGGPKRPSTQRSGSSYGQFQSMSGSAASSQEKLSQDLPRTSSNFSDSGNKHSGTNSSTRMSLDQYPQSIPAQLSPEQPIQPTQSEESLHLPPPPSEIDDEFVPVPRSSQSPTQTRSSRSISSHQGTPKSSRQSSIAAARTPVRPRESTITSPNQTSQPSTASEISNPTKQPSRRTLDTPITEEETRVTIDLVFALLTELFSLSSSIWTIRLSLLSAAKSYLLRPSNPQLDSIRVLLQESVVDAYFTSDSGLAAQIRKVRENTLPTTEELEKWPKEPTPEEKERLRVKARKLLVERGMPSALTSVVGQAACDEVLGRLFDCLQVESVSRGLVFALVLQAIRAITQ